MGISADIAQLQKYPVPMEEGMFTTLEDVLRNVAGTNPHGATLEDVEDIYRCMVLHLKKLTNKNKHFAIRLPHLGYLYKKEKDFKGHGCVPLRKRLKEELRDSRYYKSRFKSNDRKTIWWKDTPMETIQEYQNNGIEYFQEN